MSLISFPAPLPDPSFKLTKRQKDFCISYTTPGCPGYGNATQSARDAGYSARVADRQGPRLMGYAGIKSYIAALEQSIKDITILPRQIKASIAWHNYLNNSNPADKKFWWTEHCKLSGDYISRTEVYAASARPHREADPDRMIDMARTAIAQASRITTTHSNIPREMLHNTTTDCIPAP